MSDEKKLSNPASTGDAGGNFERHVQAAYAVLMLSGGFPPALANPSPIVKMKLQGRHEGYHTDDLIIFMKDPISGNEARLLGQIKLSLSLTQNDNVFEQVIKSMWIDFNNPSLFMSGSDALALITGPLSKSDIENVGHLLELARQSENASDFIKKINTAIFSSDEQRHKLRAFKTQLEKAKGSTIPDEELWQFLKSFHLIGYDFDLKHGVTRSLIESIISTYAPCNVKGLWTQIVDEVSYSNRNAGVLKKDSFSTEIGNAFAKKEIKTIPSEIVSKIEEAVKAGIEENFFTPEIAQVFLLGAWDESQDDDKKIIEKVTDASYRKWITPIQMIGSQPNFIIEHRNRKWKFKNRVEQWKKFAPLLYDDHLDRFKEIAVAVLSEKDPKFELSKEQRYAASIYGKKRVFSKSLVHGIAEGVALIGTFSHDLTSCSVNKAEVTAALLVREVLASNEWEVWSSLDDYLPLLAEASPAEFLDAIEKKLNNKSSTLFQSIFAQEGGGTIGGWNYITGVLWGLETLAWSPEHLPRVTILLGQLAEIDPGGNWANRPINSLTTIFLPWLPQTTADIDVRKTSVAALLRECPTICWQLVLTLLPSMHQVSSGSHKPIYRDFIPAEFRKSELSEHTTINHADYSEQVEYYSLLAVENARSDLNRLKELVGELDNLPWPALSHLIEYLSSDQIISLQDDQKVEVWEKLMDLVLKHRRFSDATWAMPATLVDRISNVAQKLVPSSPMFKYRRLFGQHELHSEKGDYQEQEREIANRRTDAVKEILTTLGIAALLEFAHFARFPTEVGQALGRIEGINQDSVLLPDRLIDSDKVITEVVRGYIWSRFHLLGWEWVDDLDKRKWSNEQKAQFLICLPFMKETWSRASALLDGNEILYWKEADARPYQLKDDLKEAVQKLLQYKRPRATIQCLHWMLYEKMEISLHYTYQALLTNLTSDEPPYSLDQHDTLQLIKWLQNNPNVDTNVLSQIEWLYLSWLDHHFDQAPKTLESKLANEPEFFCEVIRIVFKSEKREDNPEELTEERKQLVTHVYELLFRWRIPPGTMSDGSFDGNKLNKWLAEVKRLCEESGHLGIALDQVGKVFAHSVSDPSGLWIHKAIAEILSEKDADEMRSAFNVEKFNMREVHGFTAGEAEREIASTWRKKAEEVEKEGYVRFADSLRKFAASYDRDAQREASRDPYED